MKVVVVGAGLGGLTAATRLSAAGHDVVVLEGRAEVGGRSRSRPVTGDVVELGAQFISTRHRRMRKLVTDAGLHLARGRYAAGPVLWRQPNDQAGHLIPHLAPTDLIALARLLLGPRSLRWLVAANRVELQRAELDAQSVADFFGHQCSASLRYFIECLVGALFGGAKLEDISLLSFAELLGREGGTLRFVIGEVGGASHIVEGTGALATHLACRLTTPVHLQATVNAVEQDNSTVAAHVDNGDVVEADHAIIAVPTPTLAGIKFTPSLPDTIDDANTGINYGRATKLVAVVPPRGPFQAQAFIGGNLITAGWRTRRVLYGFTTRIAAGLDVETLADDLCRGFGVSPGLVEHAELVSWPEDRFTGGTYAHLLPGRFSQFRRSLPHRHRRVRFAGAERSSWPLFMEGAVESGEQAADSTIRASLQPRNCVTSPLNPSSK